MKLNYKESQIVKHSLQQYIDRSDSTHKRAMKADPYCKGLRQK